MGCCRGVLGGLLLVAALASPAWVVPAGAAVAHVNESSSASHATKPTTLVSSSHISSRSSATYRDSGCPVNRFDGPQALAVSGSDLFVADLNGDSVTEVSASTGALVRVILGSSYKFDNPDALAVSGPDLLVANAKGNSVTEVRTTTGALVRVITGSSYKFNGPDALAVSKGDLLVANYGNAAANLLGSITEAKTATGSLLRVISGSSYKGHPGP